MCDERVCVVCGDDYKVRASNYEGENFGKLMCNKHLLQVRRHGKITNETKSRRRDERVCDVCGGNTKVQQINCVEGEFKGKLLCSKHLGQVITHGKIIDANPTHTNREKICEICGKVEDVLYWKKTNQLLCRKHWGQLYKTGRFTPKRPEEKNKIIQHEDYAEMVLFTSKGIETGRALIDLEDIEKIQKHSWRIGTWGYPETKVYGETTYSIFLHNFLFPVKDDELVDHIDRNPLNNKKENFRIANKSLNSINAGLRNNNKTNVTGICFDNRTESWRAYINYKGKRIELGFRKNFDEAVKLRLEAELKYYPDFAPQKHLFEKYGIGVNM